MCRWRSLEVRGSPELQNGGLRALEDVWDDFLLEAFSCQVCSFSVLLGRLKLVPEGVELRTWTSLKVGGNPELQNGGQRALENAWDDCPGHLALLDRVLEVLVFCLIFSMANANFSVWLCGS